MRVLVLPFQGQYCLKVEFCNLIAQNDGYLFRVLIFISFFRTQRVYVSKSARNDAFFRRGSAYLYF